jgi:uncharacterized protein (TIGR02453 family)
MAGFDHFPPETKAFLLGIAEHNDKEWFAASRALYEAGYVDPARAVVDAIGPELRKLSPTLQFEPKIGASIGRVNRDTRFSRDKRPYKDNLDLWFWHGEKKSFAQPGFFVRLTGTDVWLGAGMHHIEDELLTRYRKAIIDERSGAALVTAIAEVEAAGDYGVGGMSRKSFPRGYDKAHQRAKYLLWEGLPAMAHMTIDEALSPGFGDRALTHFRNTWPMGQWLLDEVTGLPAN